MMHVDNYVKDAWDVNTSLGKNLGKYVKAGSKEAGRHKFVEAGCVLTCAVGDGFATYFTENNFLGYLGGIILGGTYGVGHVYIESIRDEIKARFGDVIKAAGTAEFGCALSATLVPLFIATVSGANFDPSSLKDILTLEAISYPFALPVGLAAMSGLSLMNKDEAGGLITNRGVIYDVADALKDVYRIVDNRNERGVATPAVTAHGNNSRVTITEENLSGFYKDKFDSDNSSLYRVFSPAARIFESAKISAAGLACDTFTKIGLKNHEHVRNPFDLSHENHRH